MVTTLVATDDPDDGAWMSTAAAAAQLRVTSRTLYRLIDSGRLPGYRFGGMIRVRRRDVESLRRDGSLDDPR
jgi:excisionase family DNA binding protein